MSKLLTDAAGPGSIEEVERYIAAVIRERTDVKPDTRENPFTTPEGLARAVRKSVLHRLGFLDWNAQ